MRPVLLDIEPSHEPLATTASCAAALRLLSRGALGPVRLLAPTSRTRRWLGASLSVITERQAPQAIRDSSLVVLAGTLADAKVLERAARWVVLAKAAGVPVALAAVRLPAVEPEHPALAILAQCDSVSAGDLGSARCLAALRHDRIECTAPLELLLEVEAPAPEQQGFRVGLCARTLRRGGKRLTEILQQLSASASAQVVVLEVGESRRQATRHGFQSRRITSWNEALQAASCCDLFVAEPDSMWLHMAAAVGAAPVAWLDGCERSELHERLGLTDLVLSQDTKPGALVAGLERGRSLAAPSLRRRIATLRMVAWRSLGILAQAVRSTPLDLERLQPGTRQFVAQLQGSSRLTAECMPAMLPTSTAKRARLPRANGARRVLKRNPQTEPPMAERLESGRSSCTSKR